MEVLRLLHEGRIREALAEQDCIIRDGSAGADALLMAADLSLIAGDFHSVRRYLDHVPKPTLVWNEYLNAYARLVSAEEHRQQMLHEGDPDFLLTPPEHCVHRINALNALQDGSHQVAVERLDDADSLAPWVSGHVDGREFDGLRKPTTCLRPSLKFWSTAAVLGFPLRRSPAYASAAANRRETCFFFLPH